MEIKLGHLILLAILLLAFGTRLYHVEYPYLDHHSWRQTFTAMIARNFYTNGFNVLRPEIDFNGDHSSVVESELQITTFLTAILYIFFGVQDWVGRIFPILFSILSAVYLFKLIKYRYNEKLALFATFVFVILPLNVFFTRVPMPESAMILFTIASFYHFSKYTKKENEKDFTLTLIFVSLAILSKLVALYLFIPLFFVTYEKYRKKLFYNKRLWLLFLIPVLIMVSYYGYVHYNSDVGIVPYNFITEGKNVGFWLDSSFYMFLFSRFSTVIFTPVGLLLFAVGIVLGRKDAFFFSWLSAVLLYFFIMAGSAPDIIHSYYQIPIIPVGSFFIGLTLYRIYEIEKLKYLSFVLCASLFYLSIIYLLPLYDMYAYSALDAAVKLQEIDTENSLIVSVPHRNDIMPEMLYYANRKGWVERPDGISSSKIDEYVSMGAKYMVMTEPYYIYGNTNFMDYLQTKEVYYGENFIIVRL